MLSERKRGLLLVVLTIGCLVGSLWSGPLPAALHLAAPVAEGAPVRGSQTPATCTSLSATATPASTTAGTAVVIRGQGFQPQHSVTITIVGPVPKGPFTVAADSQCQVAQTVATTGDLPGTYQVTLRGDRWECCDDVYQAVTVRTQYTLTAVATPTNTAPPTNTPPPSCPLPSAGMLSSRLQPGQTATVTGRGFRPGSTVQIDIDGPSGRFDTAVGTVGTACDVVQAFPRTASAPPGRYVVTVRGSNVAGSPVTATTEFEIVGGGATPAGPTATLPPDVPTPTTGVPPTPTQPGQPPATPPLDLAAPITIDQSLTVTGGSQVPTVGETTEYLHTMQITNTGGPALSGELRAASLALPLGTGQVVALLQGDTLTLRTTTEYSADTRITAASSNVGQPSAQGSTLVWEGRLSPGQTLTLNTNLQQTPTTASTLNQPVQGQSVVVTNSQGRPLTPPAPPRPLPPPPQRLVQPPPPPVDPATGARFFPETGFGVGDDNIWLYFNRRGGLRTFGAPISRLMLLNGAWVQLFEKGMLQVFEDGRVVSVNLLEPPYLPYEAFGDLSLPPVDDGLVLGAPDPAAPDFAARAQEYVRANAPEQFGTLGTRFYATFLGTVLFRDAFWDGRGDPNLIPGFDLEIWGLPTSGPAQQVLSSGEVDPAVALLRFQRGVMIHDARAGTTTAAGLGYYLRAIIAGDSTQAGLAEVAGGSPLWAQYDPAGLDWVARPQELAETNLVLVFTREDDAGEAVPTVPTLPRATSRLFLQVLQETPTYADSGAQVGTAAPGERYRVLQQESGWVLVVAEADPAGAGVWIELTERVRASIE